jgi:hypothetical protein
MGKLQFVLFQRRAIFRQMLPSGYDLIEPFDTDDGSLKDVTAQEAFALGVEWLMFRRWLMSGKPFKTLCLSNNAARLVKLAERNNRFVEDRQTGCVGWTEIWVGDYVV